MRLVPAARLFAIVAALGGGLSCGGRELGAKNPVSPSPLASLLQGSARLLDGDDEGEGLGFGESVLVGAGDIAMCGSPGAEKTAALLDRLPGTVFVAGDNAYMNGSGSDYRNCYGPTWGRHVGRTRPVPGNHEYQTAGASGYFGYFGARAGSAGLGYYRYTAGSWLVLALNSEIAHGAGSPQLEWVREQLQTTKHPCTAVYWHRPLFSSGVNGPNPDMLDLWRVLYEHDVEIVINGHDHLYERFAPQTPEGLPDAARGIRQFTVGTGGAPPYDVMRRAANSEIAASVWGVASFTLRSDAYTWQFVPVAGEAFSDFGTAPCH